ASYPGGTGILGTAASARCPAARSARASAAGARGGSAASPGPPRPAWTRAARESAKRWLVAAAPLLGGPKRCGSGWVPAPAAAPPRPRVSSSPSRGCASRSWSPSSTLCVSPAACRPSLPGPSSRLASSAGNGAGSRAPSPAASAGASSRACVPATGPGGQRRARDATRDEAIGAPEGEACHVLLDEQRQQGRLRLLSPAELDERREPAGEAAPVVDPERRAVAGDPAAADVAHDHERGAERRGCDGRDGAREEARRCGEGEENERRR